MLRCQGSIIQEGKLLAEQTMAGGGGVTTTPTYYEHVYQTGPHVLYLLCRGD
jgi:hypothetical protein